MLPDAGVPVDAAVSADASPGDATPVDAGPQSDAAVAQPDEEPPYPVRMAFQRCLASSTDSLLVRQVEAYVATNPASSKGPMVAVIMRAVFDLCRSEIERQSPKGAPSQR